MNPVLVAVEIGFLIPKQENLIVVPAETSALSNAFETVNISVVVSKVQVIVLSTFSKTPQLKLP